MATPIGNLRDITLRALDVLAAADLVLAEDTRVTGKLLAAYGLEGSWSATTTTPAARAAELAIERLRDGAAVALVSDAGTPLVSDPGYRLVPRPRSPRACRCIPIPGASGLLAALCVAGLPTDRFLFAGFPPPKSAARRTFLEELAGSRATLVFFEGGSRLAASLADMAAVFGAAPRGGRARADQAVRDLHPRAAGRAGRRPALQAPKGEIVVLVGPGETEVATEADADAALADALTRLRPGEAAAEVAKALGLPRKRALPPGAGAAGPVKAPKPATRLRRRRSCASTGWRRAGVAVAPRRPRPEWLAALC